MTGGSGIATAGAWIIGEQTEAAATLILFAVAEWLDSTASRTRVARFDGR